MNTVMIRRYETTDLDGIIDVFVRAIRETACLDYCGEQIAVWAQVDRSAWEKAYGGDERLTWVAVDGGRPVGFATLAPSGLLGMMYVHPEHQMRGIATALAGTVEAAARSQGLSRIFTNASITARPFFAKRGFQELASQVVERRGVKFTNFRMAKELA
jgi:putative acetyltransferase